MRRRRRVPAILVGGRMAGEIEIDPENPERELCFAGWRDDHMAIYHLTDTRDSMGRLIYKSVS